MDLWHLAGLKDSIGYTAERRADVEREYEAASVANVGLAGTRRGLHGARSRGRVIAVGER